MDLQWSAADIAFRDEVRSFLDDKLTPELRTAGRLMTSVYADHDASMEWQRILHERGWAAPAWPVEYGGCDWSLTQHYIFSRESTLAGAPVAVADGHPDGRARDHRVRHRRRRRTSSCRASSPARCSSARATPNPRPAPTWRRCRWRPSTTATTWCAPAARSGRRTPREANWMFALGAHLAQREEAAGHHVRADRHDHRRASRSARW